MEEAYGTWPPLHPQSDASRLTASLSQGGLVGGVFIWPALELFVVGSPSIARQLSDLCPPNNIFACLGPQLAGRQAGIRPKGGAGLLVSPIHGYICRPPSPPPAT